MKKFSIRDRLRSFKYAFRGALLLLSQEHNTWIHLTCAILAVGFGFHFGISQSEWFAVIISIGMVLSAEAFNTAIERIADYIQPDKDPNIALIKDMAAGAVLFTAISAFIVGVIIFLPKFLSIITR